MLVDIDPDKRTATCVVCGDVGLKYKGISVYTGHPQWQCYFAHRKNKRPHSHLRKNYCERCGFIAESMCQLDGHHIDYNHTNNNSENIMTLCANCHRLEHSAD